MNLALPVYISLGVFALGLLVKAATWLGRGIGPEASRFSFGSRLSAAAAGVLSTVFSPKLFTLAAVFFRDILFQWPILRESFVRWAMHMAIFLGFMFLLFFHALGKYITSPLFGENYAYLMPFLLLRDLAGVLVLLGLAVAVIRRFVMSGKRLKTSAMDVYAILIVGLIIVSGFVLCSVKMTSLDVFARMAQDYGSLDPEGTPDDFRALETYWAANYGLVSPTLSAPYDENLLATGEGLNESCVSCHAKNSKAPASFALARFLAPAARSVNGARDVDFLYWLHVLACLVGLAVLPFTKMFHVIATPVALFLKKTVGPFSRPENLVTRRVAELSACTHCGTCSLHCSAMMAYHVSGNRYVLPSEKIGALKKIARGRKLSDAELAAVSNGIMLCTNCDRCTAVCPSGLELKELWLFAREQILLQGRPEPLVRSPFALLRGLSRARLPKETYPEPAAAADRGLSAAFAPLLDADRETEVGEKPLRDLDPSFAACFGCTNCTSVCPVVASFEEPVRSLGLVPHQIMAAVGMGLSARAAGCSMVRDCLTCYQCQEHCPQNVAVTDLIYGLKELAAKNLETDSPSIA